MDWSNPFKSTASEGSPPSILPRLVLRQLLRSNDIGIGAKVLDVGCGGGEFVRYLRYLSIEGSGLCESADEAAQAGDAIPNADFHSARISQSVPLAEHQFDVVLVRKLKEYQAELFSPAALAATANLLACVRPGGRLLVLMKCMVAPADDGTGHGISCHVKQLSVFPGRCRVFGRPIGRQWNPLQRLLSNRQVEAYLTASLQIPEDPILRAEWHRYAKQATAKNLGPCCNRCIAGAPAVKQNRSAA